MNCEIYDLCGGCSSRKLTMEEYRQKKFDNFKKIISQIGENNIKINQPVYIADGCRRRATFAFEYKKKNLALGFNAEASHQIIDIKNCPLLTEALNNIIPFVRELTDEICREPYNEKQGKKIVQKYITKGDVFICEASNGIDIVLEYDAPLELNHRMIIFDIVSKNDL